MIIKNNLLIFQLNFILMIAYTILQLEYVFTGYLIFHKMNPFKVKKKNHKRYLLHLEDYIYHLNPHINLYPNRKMDTLLVRII